MDLGVDQTADLEQDVARAGLVDSPLQRAGAVGIEIGDIDDAAAAPAGGVRAEAFRTGERRERGGRARGRTDRNRDGSSCGATASVADRHGEAVLQIRRCRAGGCGVVTRSNGRGVGERTGTGTDTHSALGRRRRSAVGQRVTISVGRTHTARHDTRHRVGATHRRGTRHRGAVARGGTGGGTDRNRDGSSCGATMCVADRHGEAVLQIGRCRAGGRGIVTRRDSGRIGERARAGNDAHAALARRRWCAVGQGVTVSVGGAHTAAHHTRHRVRRSHHRCAHHRRAISRGEWRDRDRHGAGGRVSATSEQTEGKQIDQPGHTVDGETAGGIADGHPKRVGATGRHGRIRCVAPTAVHADRRDASGGVGGDRVAQPGAVGVDSVELSGNDTGGALRGLGRA